MVFLKWNVSKKTSYIVRNNKLPGNICMLNLRSERKNIFARGIIRDYSERRSQRKQTTL